MQSGETWRYRGPNYWGKNYRNPNVGFPRWVIVLLWCHCCNSILIENLSVQISVLFGAFEVPQQQESTLPFYITESVCGWFLRGTNKMCLDSWKPEFFFLSFFLFSCFMRNIFLEGCHIAPSRSSKISTCLSALINFFNGNLLKLVLPVILQSGFKKERLVHLSTFCLFIWSERNIQTCWTWTLKHNKHPLHV